MFELVCVETFSGSFDSEIPLGRCDCIILKPTEGWCCWPTVDVDGNVDAVLPVLTKRIAYGGVTLVIPFCTRAVVVAV